MRSPSSAPNAAASVAMGRAIFSSFSDLLGGDLDTAAVAAVHAQALRSVRRVDPSMSLHVFGSTAVYGLHPPGGSDVDFVALTREEREDGRGADASSEVAKGLQTQLLTRVAAALREEHPTWPVEVVTRTRVPVLRAKGGGVPVDFDVTFSRRNGVRNSALLRSYFAQAPAARWLSMAVKAWSKRVGLNSSVETGCITSYGFNVMVAAFLLRRGHVSYVDPASCDVAHIDPMPPYMPLVLPSGGSDRSTSGISSSGGNTAAASSPSSSSSAPAPQPTPLRPTEEDCRILGSLALDFIDYYGGSGSDSAGGRTGAANKKAHAVPIAPFPGSFNMTPTPHATPHGGGGDASQTSTPATGDNPLTARFDPDTQVVTLSRPTGVATREELQWTRQAEDLARMRGEKIYYRWCIEDPYEDNLNVGRFVTPLKLMLLRKSLLMAKDTNLHLTSPTIQ